jgi:hypothetical protein
LIARSRSTFAVDTFIVVDVNVAEATVEVQNRLGLHLRAASALAQTAAKFASKVMIGTDKDDLVSAKRSRSSEGSTDAVRRPLRRRIGGEIPEKALRLIDTFCVQ